MFDLKTIKKTLKQFPFSGNIPKAMNIGRAGARMQLLKTLPKQMIGAEVGVHLGNFSSEILRVARPRTLFLIDPWKYESGDVYKHSHYGGRSENKQELEDRYRSVQTRFATEIKSGQVVIMRKDSGAALPELEDGSLDFVYIDGNHLYEFAMKDLELSFRKVKSGGYITGDDYEPDGWWKGGVKKAVDEFGWKDGVSLLWINGCQFVFLKQ